MKAIMTKLSVRYLEHSLIISLKNEAIKHDTNLNKACKPSCFGDVKDVHGNESVLHTVCFIQWRKRQLVK